MLAAIIEDIQTHSNHSEATWSRVQQWTIDSSDWATVVQMAKAVSSDASPSGPQRSSLSRRDVASSSSSAGLRPGGNGTSGTGETELRPAVDMTEPRPPISDRVIQAEPNSSGGRGSDGSESWACVHCTYLNQTGSSECEICGLPRNG
ncbi:unnamed protein product [Protopolystoma xenopodis]|uniref:RanBP2-type domain-containing protein n=1 Tax=Protopolystoma xenopodis TaxID=117903 RepID=A0A448XRL1_9PLAT|nr:unnamed protein product [Protopolystoma xenopodis]